MERYGITTSGMESGKDYLLSEWNEWNGMEWNGMEWNAMQRYSIRTIIYNQESIIYLARVSHGMEWNAEVFH